MSATDVGLATPAPGSHLLGIAITVWNHGSTPYSLSPSSQFVLLDAQRHIIPPIPSDTAGSHTLREPIAAGSSVTGTVFFELSDTVAATTLAFRAGSISAEWPLQLAKTPTP